MEVTSPQASHARFGARIQRAQDMTEMALALDLVDTIDTMPTKEMYDDDGTPGPIRDIATIITIYKKLKGSQPVRVMGYLGCSTQEWARALAKP